MQPRPGPDTAQQRGVALLAALFVLAIGTALVARMVADGLAARRLAASTAPLVQAARADLALDILSADLLRGDHRVPRQRTLRVDGVDIDVAWALESGRIDLNFLPEAEMVKALASVGLKGDDARQAARAVAAWRGDDGPGPRDGRQAFWSLEDIDRIPDIGPSARRALRRWGSVAARGPFAGVAMLESEGTVGTAIGYGSGNGLMSGILLCLTATISTGGCRSRVVMAVPRDGRLVFRRVMEDGQCPG